LEFLSVSQDNAGGTTTKAKYSGFAGYVTFMFTPKIRGVVRAESFDDKDGLRFGAASQKYKEVTLTGAFLASDSFEARAEVRRDQGNNKVFSDSTGTLSKDMTSVALQGLYKF